MYEDWATSMVWVRSSWVGSEWKEARNGLFAISPDHPIPKRSLGGFWPSRNTIRQKTSQEVLFPQASQEFPAAKKCFKGL